jgi:hypothetical protein
VDEDGPRTWTPVHRGSSPIARWLPFVVKGFQQFWVVTDEINAVAARMHHSVEKYLSSGMIREA